MRGAQQGEAKAGEGRGAGLTVRGGALSTGELGRSVSTHVTLSTELRAPPPASWAAGRRHALLPQGGKKWESFASPHPGDGSGLGKLALNTCCTDGGDLVPPRPRLKMVTGHKRV